jgi:Pyridoxamine 5'-phosphate oxidase
MAIPDAARRVLSDGILCHLGAPGPGGPHVTPVVFVLDADRVWATVARGTAKARRWRKQPVAAGLVQVGDLALTFRGPVMVHDALDPGTWGVSIARAPQVARASVRFSVKNARFFAGYARDAARVPLGWTPPGRVFASVDLESGALLEGASGEVAERWGDWGSRLRSRPEFRATRRGPGPEDRLPDDLRPLVEGSGRGVVGLEGSRGPTILPAGWARAGGWYHAVLPKTFLALATAGADGPAALVMDRASSWRAAKMRGVLLRGHAETYVPARLRTGRQALEARARRTGEVPRDPAVLRFGPDNAVWWKGWASATVGRP